MQILRGIEGLRQVPKASVLSVGNFDGIHRGHARLLASAAEYAKAAGNCAGSPPIAAQPRNQSGISPAADAPPIDGNIPPERAAIVLVTFEPHPLTVLRPALAPARLISPARKQELLAAAGVDFLVILPPTQEVLDMTAEEFWALLRDDVRPAHMIEGSAFTFGKNRGGDIERLREWSSGTAVQLHIIDPVSAALLNLQIVPVSSSIIRWLLSHGRARDAAICLGRPHALEGPVEQGHQRGRTIGVPTANLRCDQQLVPADGVYAARCVVDGRLYPAALSIGTLPTFDGDQRQVEAHLIGFEGDLYGKFLRIEVLDWIREQIRFAGLTELKAHIARDIDVVVARSGRDVTRAIAEAVLV